MTGRVWQGWAIPLPGGGTYLNQDAAKLVHFLLRYYAGVAGARNGLAELSGSPLVREVMAACETSMRPDASEVGQVIRTPGVIPPPSVPRPDDLLTMTDVAEALGVSDRTARRKAQAGHFGPVTRAGHALLVRRVEVDAAKTLRRAS